MLEILEKKKISKEEFKSIILNDYKIAIISRETSILGRKEVLTGKAKFGIFGDGKELAQIAMAKQFKEGDFRAGYYRDQTFMMAIGQLTVKEFFAQLYANTDRNADPSSAGRQMNAHFSTRTLNEDGSWKDLTKIKNSSADVSPTGSQMPRLLGLAYASKIYRNVKELNNFKKFSNNGNEIAFGTIGEASTSEGLFWETINAAGVLQVPMLLSVWDDGYGISVPVKYQTTKSSIYKVLQGFQRTKEEPGFEILKAKGWDYVELNEVYEKAAKICREEHVPVLIHVYELTQPQGHSTSGSHERYKSKERLEWEKEFDCINKFKKWIIEKNIADETTINKLEKEAKNFVREEKNKAWEEYRNPIKKEINELASIITSISLKSKHKNEILQILNNLKTSLDPIRKDIVSTAKKTLRVLRNEKLIDKEKLINWLNNYEKEIYDKYDSFLYSETKFSPLKVKEVKPIYSDNPDIVDGRIILRDNFDYILKNYPEVLIFGEDSGLLGDVNQGLEGLQKKYGEYRVSDTGIREATIVGQGIGLAMRGLRPIAEIQYLDYLLYALQIMSDDLATVFYRTKGGQKAPLIVRTRGHRLEGIWHSGSPMGTLINAFKGIYICVPRNMTDAAGFYNTILQGDNPALIIEPLNAYRTKEKMPQNIGKFTTALGIPEVVVEGNDITMVSYGSTFNICHKVIPQLNEVGIYPELIDVKTLIPFDINNTILKSLQKTNKIIFIDEDVPSGTTAYLLDKIINERKGYYYLDSEPKTLTAKEHRPAYGSDGDYFSKPNEEDIFDAVYAIMNESNPSKFPDIYERKN